MATWAFVSVGCVSAATHYVNPGESIQAAVTAADSGDTIIVRDGTYTENINVNKRLTIQSENGPQNCIVHAANPDDVFEVTADYVNISGFTVFTVKRALHYNAGICLYYVDSCIVSNNFVYTTKYSGYYGISITHSSYNNVTNNHVWNHSVGIFCGGYYNTISDNFVSNNTNGISLTGENNIVDNNSVNCNSCDGIYLLYSSNNTITNNTVTNNSAYGIFISDHSNNNVLYNNLVAYNYWGIASHWAYSNVIYLNNFRNGANRNVHYCKPTSATIWNSTEPILYQYNSKVYTNYLGNMWNDYTGSDANEDGIGDTAYQLSGGVDYAPLITYFENYVLLKNQPPTAVIDSLAPNPAKQGRDTVSFIGHGNDSDGSVVAYNWTSSIDGLLNTSLSFTKPASELSVGKHTIYFSVLDDGGAWSSPDTENLTIVTNQLPVAAFSYSPMNPSMNETVTFNASASYDPDGSIVSYNWSFGDGNLTNSTDSTTTHSYGSVGNYTVNLIVTDNDGATNTTSRALQVCLKPPIATFSCSPPNPGVNETVTFNASGSYDPNGVITSYEFEFGDGTNGTGEVVTHSYFSVGMYTVNLTLTDSEGATNRTSKTIKVFFNVSYLDTESGTYPSICGTHNGTITMTHTVNVSKIYLYPCLGTGGHIKYAKIWNTSWDGAEACWNGYVDDWHNLPFDKNFTLVAGETYNYTIQTGSYPQIHHTDELLTAKGLITCSEFVDINGKRHEGWIPAIRLE